MSRRTKKLILPALEIKQGRKRTLYSFAIDGKLLSDVATISRVRREDNNELEGYQRPEVLSHISEIQSYLESTNPMIPNSLVIAFDSRVKFKPGRSKKNGTTGYSRLGKIEIPIDSSVPKEGRPGWIVDGQQRIAAIRDARIRRFPVSVVAFITDDVREQREQFLLVNSTKPLPKGLLYELLPGTEAMLPTLLKRRRFPAKLLQRLNFEDSSPLKGMIRTPTNSGGVIKDNSILKMLENSLYDGALYRFRDPNSGKGDEESMLKVLGNFWKSTSRVFSDAWGLPPTRSRLMHGAGIVSMGFLMDEIAERNRGEKIPTKTTFTSHLTPLREVCQWTSGYWDFGPGCKRKWNEIQNVPRDVQALAIYLVSVYRERTQ